MPQIIEHNGVQYEYPDDTPDDLIIADLNKVGKAQPISNALLNAPAQVSAGIMSGLRGLAEQGQDFITKPLAKVGSSLLDPTGALAGTPQPQFTGESEAVGLAKKGEEYWKGLAEAGREGTPTEFSAAVSSAAQSTGQALTLAPLAVARGLQLIKGGATAAEALTGGFIAPLKAMAGLEAGKEYAEQKDAGSTPEVAAMASAITGAAEYFPEKWGQIKLIDAIAGKNKVGNALFGFLLRDMGGEQVTLAVQDLTKKLTRSPDMTMEDYLRDVRVTAMATAMGGPVQAGTSRVSGAVVQGVLDRAAARAQGVEAPRIEPTVSDVPPPQPESAAAPTPETPPTPSVVEPTSPRGSLVLDSEVPIIGQPADSQANSRQLSIEDQITLLRKSYEEMQKTSFQDDAVTRIRKRGDFVNRLANVNSELRLNPEGRSFLMAADAAMGVEHPGVDVSVEQAVNDYAVLTPEQAQRREALREQQAQEAWSGTLLQRVPLDPSKPTGPSVGATFGLINNTDPSGPALSENFGGPKEVAQLFGRSILRSTNASLVGLPYEQAIQQAAPSDIIFAADAELANAGNVAEVMGLLESYKSKFLPNATLVVAGYAPKEGTVSSAWKLPGKNAYAINLPRLTALSSDPTNLETSGTGPSSISSLPMTRSVAELKDTVSHEFTHVMHVAHWQSATPAEKASVAKEYHDDLRYASKATIADAARRLYSPSVAEWVISNAKAEGLDPNTELFMSDASRAVLFPHKKPEYWFNFSEWMAHKGVKYFQTRLGVVKENVPFFRRWIQKMKAFYDNYSAQFAAPGPAFAQWMDNIAVRESFGLGLATTQDIADAKAKMIEAGVHPDVAELMTTVNADRKQVLNNAVYAVQKQAQTVQAVEAYEAQLGSIGEAFFGGQSRGSVSKGLENSELAQALLASPKFADEKSFNAAEFAHSLYANMFAVGEQRSMVTSNSLDYVYTSPQGHTAAVYFNRTTNKVVVDTSAYMESSAATSAELGAVTQTLPKLAEAGYTTVDVSGLSTEVQKVLVGKAKGVDVKHLELPYWAYEAPAEPADLEMRLPASLVSIGAKLGVPWLNTAGNQLGRFNWLFGKSLGTYELINLNADVPGMQEERQALRSRMMYRHQWLAPANARVEEWAYGIGKTQAAKLGRLLFDEAELGTHYSTRHRDPNNPSQWIFIMDPTVANNRGIDQKTQELYSKVRNDFRLFAEEWHKTALWEFARGELSDVTQNAIFKLMQEPGGVDQAVQVVNMEISAVQDPVRMQRLMATEKDINDQFRAWTDTPYMPYTRFGRYGTLVRDGKTGKTLYFSGHDSLPEAREKAKELGSTMAGHAVSVTYLEDKVFELAGLPPAVLQAMRTKLQLDPQQQEVFSAVLQQLSLANSFRHHAAEKKGIEGFSLDALRAYSDYFRRGSSFMARVKSNPQLADAQVLLEKHIQAMTATVGEQEVVNLHRLHEWFGNLHKYLNAPGDEYGQLKSAVAMFHFAGNVSSAVMNTTQVPLVTLPWLSARYDTTSVVKELGKAYKDSLSIWAKKTPLSADEEALYNHALASGFLDESQATTIGQMADGAALARATLTGWSQKTIGAVNHYGMWMFAKAEFLNRTTTLLAAYRLAKSQRFQGKFDQAAYDFARQAVEDTQNEYAQENRPEIMRGKGSVVMQFMHYTTHMLFMQLGGDKAWWRLLIAQLSAGGLLGLPFAGDLANMAKFLARKVGIDVEPEQLLREHLKELGVDQDLVARGLFADVFGLDLSKRVSMGEVIPGVRALGSNRKFSQVIYEALGDVAGPGASLILNAMKFVSEDDKLAWNSLRQIMPTALKNTGNAIKAFKEGEVRDQSGAKVFEPDTWDVIGMAVGFQPKELSKHYLEGTLQSEQAAYWVNRKQALLGMWNHIVFDRGHDREASADFMKRLNDYNKDAPPGMTLSGASLRASSVAKAKAMARKELGLGTTRGMESEAMRTREILEE